MAILLHFLNLKKPIVKIHKKIIFHLEVEPLNALLRLVDPRHQLALRVLKVLRMILTCWLWWWQRSWRWKDNDHDGGDDDDELMTWWWWKDDYHDDNVVIIPPKNISHICEYWEHWRLKYTAGAQSQQIRTQTQSPSLHWATIFIFFIRTISFVHDEWHLCVGKIGVLTK